MGFIEDLRRQREAERQTAEKVKQLAETRAQQEQAVRERIARAEIARINEERQRSYGFLIKVSFQN